MIAGTSAITLATSPVGREAPVCSPPVEFMVMRSDPARPHQIKSGFAGKGPRGR